MNKYTDQEFTYRETPVSYDGIAKLDSIKGNTVAWNQLAKPLNSTNYGSVRATATYSNDVCTITTTSANTICGIYISSANFGAVIGHKYLFMCTVNPSITRTFRLGLDSITTTADELSVTASKDNLLSIVQTATTSDAFVLYLRCNAVGDTATIKNVMAIDLTMLGMDDVTDKESFQKYFSLSYYSYNSGTLVNFNGNGIKTTGKNLLSYDGENLPYSANGVSITRESNIYKIVASSPSGYPFTRISIFSYLPKGRYTVTMLGAETSNGSIGWRLIDRNVSPVQIYASQSTPTFTLTDDLYNVYFEITVDASRLSSGTWEVRYQLNRGNQEEYEPYTETITDLPISTYFPNGLKSAGDVYDELTPTKDIIRVGTVDLGSMSWTAVTVNNITRMRSYDIKTVIKYPSANNIKVNAICSKYEIQTANNTYVGQMGFSCQNNGDIYVYDSAYTDATAFTTAMSGVMLNYELATPTEQDINADLFYKFYGNGTEEILPSSMMNGSVDLGSLTWTYTNAEGHLRFVGDVIADIKIPGNNILPNVMCSNYETVLEGQVYNNTKVGLCITTTGRPMVYDPSFTDATAFKNSLQGVMLWYEKSDSTPSTSAFFGDITYYNTFEGEVPYRKFWMVNSKGERWNLTEREVRSFLNNPQGLGFSKTINTTRYGNAQVLTDITDNFPSPSGEVLFYDSHNSTRYEQYNEFVKFISYEPVTLYYKLPFSFYSQIPNVYTLECVVGTLTKNESKNDNLMTCPITFNALSYYQGEEVNINGTGTSYTIQNDGDFPVGFEITLEGSLTNPYITLEQDGDLYGEAKFDDETAFSSVYVNSNDGEQNVVLEQGGSILPNPLSYQDLSISNGSIYVTFVKLARGESTLTIGMDSGSLTSATIKFAPIYRSV